MRRLLIVAAAWCVVGQAWAQDRSLSATGAGFAGEYSTAAAMKLLYGNFDAGMKSSVWSPKRGANFDTSWPAKVRVRPVQDFTYSMDGVMRHMLVTWARPDALADDKDDSVYTCHACGVLVGVSVLAADQGGWKVEASELQLGMFGGFGVPPGAKMQRLGEHTYGVVLMQGDMHQGESEQALWIYGPGTGGAKAGRFGMWFRVELADMDPDRGFTDDWCKTRNESQGDMDMMCVWHRIDYAMATVSGEPMYELVVTKRTGKSAVAVSRFRFNGTRYVAAKGN